MRKSLSLVRGQVRLNLLRTVKIAPYLFLLIDSFSYFLYEMDIYDRLYLYLLSIAGHSILWVIYVSIILYLLKTCLYTWACMISLLLFNVLSLFPVSTTYYTIFMLIIVITGVGMSTILILKEWYKKRYSTL